MTVVALAACGSGETAGSGTPAGAATSGSSSASSSASPSAADNGVAALSAEEILGKAKAALAATDYVRITGRAEDLGTRISVDIRYGSDKAVGTFVVDGQRLNLSRVGDAAYLKAGKGFWTAYADAELAKVVAGKYLKITLDDDRFTDLSDFTDLKQSAYDFLDLSGPLTKGGTKTEAGTPAIEVTDTSDDGGTLHVATTGQPYPLWVRSFSDEVTFTEYGKPVTVAEPPAAQVITLPEE